MVATQYSERKRHNLKGSSHKHGGQARWSTGEVNAETTYHGTRVHVYTCTMVQAQHKNTHKKRARHRGRAQLEVLRALRAIRIDGLSHAGARARDTRRPRGRPGPAAAQRIRPRAIFGNTTSNQIIGTQLWCSHLEILPLSPFNSGGSLTVTLPVEFFFCCRVFTVFPLPEKIAQKRRSRPCYVRLPRYISLGLPQQVFPLVHTKIGARDAPKELPDR